MDEETRARFRYLEDTGKERSIAISPPKFTIGRGANNNLALSSGHVSRDKVEVEVRNGEYVLRDLGSKHGMFVNGVRIIASPGFEDLFDLEPEFRQGLIEDDLKLMHFGFRFLKQVLFGEVTIPLKMDAARQRMTRNKEKVEAIEKEAAARKTEEQDRMYDSLKDD